MLDKIKVTGTLKIVLNRKGKVVREIVQKNLVMAVGLNKIARILGGLTEDPLGYIAVGDGIAAPDVSQTALQGTEHSREAVSAADAANALVLTATIGPYASTKTIAEMGIFDAAVAGDMFSRTTPVAFDMEPADTIDVTWELEFE